MIRITQIVLSLFVSASSNTLAMEPNIEWKLTDIDGKVHEPFEEQSTRGLVLVFISTDCPIANGYQPQIQRLADEYRRDGVRVFMIHPSQTLSTEEARKHASEFGITTPVVIDNDQSIARRAGATVTPQAFVFGRNQRLPIYHGRIDNLYAGYGKKRKVATTHDLADALEAVVAGRAVENAKTVAVGCFISYAE
ncbi:redoxin domain-containing protein [Neorhodopirellula pilleata]|uniref:Thiol-disulfide oxidoreductase n=1 Tax=Neorhodopirellula pilleata TaxID=2714738 RepID=A0A5C6ACI7_9BACT|nr:redoxin domain-containing protein [Neorhodopirellula pilleata]TWT97126.1 thiol-disulfide oxidoreductase [Neorhodopirellula pilleata]